MAQLVFIHSPDPLPIPQLTWAALPFEGAAAATAPVRYAVQRWPSPDMPAPGQRGYLDSLLTISYAADGEDHYTATDPAAGASANGGARPFYRVLALASTGEVLAATRPAKPIVVEGECQGRLRGRRNGVARAQGADTRAHCRRRRGSVAR